jgi:hypothetical protein
LKELKLKKEVRLLHRPCYRKLNYPLFPLRYMIPNVTFIFVEI